MQALSQMRDWEGDAMIVLVRRSLRATPLEDVSHRRPSVRLSLLMMRLTTCSLVARVWTAFAFRMIIVARAHYNYGLDETAAGLPAPVDCSPRGGRWARV